VEANTAVNICAFERCPRINRPSPVGRARRPQQRIKARLSNACQVLTVDEQSHVPAVGIYRFRRAAQVDRDIR
jgi:hypothetical protein